jgi:hypothetical protein
MWTNSLLMAFADDAGATNGASMAPSLPAPPPPLIFAASTRTGKVEFGHATNYF